MRRKALKKEKDQGKLHTFLSKIKKNVKENRGGKRT